MPSPESRAPTIEAIHPVAHRALAAWGIDQQPHFLQRVENSIYELEDAGRRLILRLTHESHRTPALVEAELDWIAHLAERGVPVVLPIRTRAGALIQILETDSGVHIATLFVRAEGRPLSFVKRPEDWNPEAHAAWGALLGRMHAATREYRPGRGVTPRYRWDTEPRYLEPHGLLPSEDEEMRVELEVCWRWMKGLPETPDCFGLIHSDAHRGNFLVDDEGKLTLFDFDDCLYAWFVMDLAMPLFYSKRHPQRPDWGRAQLEELLAGLLVGYRDHNDLDPVWIDRIWGFLRWRRVQLHISAHHWARRVDPAVLAEPWVALNRAPLGLGEIPLV